MNRTGLSKSTVLALVRDKKLKAPIKLAPRAVGWLESDIEEFIADRVKASRPTE